MEKFDSRMKIDETKEEKGETVEKETGRDAIVMNEGKTMNDTANTLNLEYTAEAQQMIKEAMSDGIDSIKDTHSTIADELDEEFSQIEECEGHLDEMESSVTQDIEALNGVSSGMQSADTGAAKKLVDDAVRAGDNEKQYLNNSNSDFNKIRTDGQTEMESQKNEIKSFGLKR